MILLAWKPGAWKETAWKAGAWEAIGEQPPGQPAPAYGPQLRGKRQRRNVEEEEAILLALLH